MRLLLVEDDPMIGASVQNGLRQEGHSVDWVRDGAAAELALASGVHELVLLDLGLPVSWRPRSLWPACAQGRDGAGAGHHGARLGRGSRQGAGRRGDDYLVKLFDLDELSGASVPLMRRHGGRASPIIEHGPLRLDPATRVFSTERRSICRARVLPPACAARTAGRAAFARAARRTHLRLERGKSRATRSRCTSIRCAASSAPSGYATCAASGTGCRNCRSRMNSIRSNLIAALIGAMFAAMFFGGWATYSAAHEASDLFDYQLQQIALSLRDQTFQGSAEALANDESLDYVIRSGTRPG